MKLKTFNLYLCDARDWQNMTWKEALIYRITKAKQAMAFYKLESERFISKNPIKYKEFADKFKKSENAKAFNEELLEEVT